MKQRARIILALDVDSIAKAKHFINKLYPKIKIFKVGSQLFTACGPKIIEYINKRGAECFLDLKFFDIPNTVAQAVRQAVRRKVTMLTLHIAAGEAVLKAAVGAGKDEAKRLKIKRPLLIGVTVLTSQNTGIRRVLESARRGMASGLDGIVCSAREAAAIRRAIKNKKFVIVTPGIRKEGSAADDQRRTASVTRAIKSGSNFLVIGRPILSARDPVQALKELLAGG